MSQGQINEIGHRRFRNTLIAVDRYLQAHPKEYWTLTLLLAQVDVSTVLSDGSTVTVPQIVAFVNKSGISAGLRDVLSRQGVVILQAMPGSGRLGKGHAEGAAAGLRNRPDQQATLLGGQMGKVREAIETTRTCTAQCGEDFTTFLDNGVSIHAGDRGWLGGVQITDKVYQHFKASLGSYATGQPAFHVLTRGYVDYPALPNVDLGPATIEGGDPGGPPAIGPGGGLGGGDDDETED
jgi:hypothetical protein